MMTKNTKIADEITKLTQDEIAEVAGGLHNRYKAPARPSSIIYGYASRLRIKRALRAAVLTVLLLLFTFHAEASDWYAKDGGSPGWAYWFTRASVVAYYYMHMSTLANQTRWWHVTFRPNGPNRDDPGDDTSYSYWPYHGPQDQWQIRRGGVPYWMNYGQFMGTIDLEGGVSVPRQGRYAGQRVADNMRTAWFDWSNWWYHPR